MKKTQPKKASKSSSSLPKPLTKSKVFNPCSTSKFTFRSTKEIKESHDIIAQTRARRAIEMGLGIRRPGYNIYVSGIQGTGKTSVIRQLLESWAKKAGPPNDWLYLYNFQNPEAPGAIEVPRRKGKAFKKAMDGLVKAFKQQIPSALQSEDYENEVNTFISNMNERKSKLFSELEKLAKSMDFVIKSSRVGIETIPIQEGRPLSEKDYNKLSDKVRNKIEARRSKLEPEVLDFARKVRNIESETRVQIETLRENLGRQIVDILIEPLREQFEDIEEILSYLQQVSDHVVENLLDFVEEEHDEDEHHPMPDDRERFNKYKVNLFVDNSQRKAAPIIIENNPTYYNLFGKIEKNVEHGMYLTDFTMIKSGSIHRASGGYLVINALDIFRNSSTWDTLKRVMRNRRGFIEDMGEQHSLLPTSGLRPDPIPLDVKVILIGNDDIYHILFDEDEEFPKIFKIKADFDWKMDRNVSNIKAYISFIATRAKVEDLLQFDRSGVAAIVEFGSRLVEDQRLLSTQFGEIKDLTIEADYIAREQGARVIKRTHVEEALEQKYNRLNLQEENLHKMVKTQDILLTVDKAVVGQINGLAVYDYGDYSFGKIGRITCTTAVSDNGITNIERASHLSGKIHDKGLMILSGFLHSVLAQKRRLGISASICFEQSYGIIDGDSASTAELIAILSAMSNIPIKQNMAITGSVNQMGEVQTIGGVNEKVEGFYKVCKLIGKGKSYGVVIPKQNVHNLMLHSWARDGVASGELNIYPVSHVWEAFELMTGVALGLKKLPIPEAYPEGSALAIIDQKLEEIYQAELGEHEEESSHKVEKKEKKPRKAVASLL